MAALEATRVRALRWTAGRLARAAGRVSGEIYVPLDYPSSAANEPRYGWGRPPHPGLRARLDEDAATYRAELEAILGLREDLLRIPRDPVDAVTPSWRQDPPWLLGLDGASLYAVIRGRRPARYLEIGSGTSTKFAARARGDGGLATRITSIDPHPRAEIDALCDEVVRAPLERADLGVFAALEAGDVLFFDGSHRAFMNSDVTVFFLDVLPSLASGVIVGIHDVLLPWDYPPDWDRRFYSEQYLLAACLLSGAPYVRPLLPCHHVATTPDLAAVLAPLWEDSRLAGVDPRGYAFWFST